MSFKEYRKKKEHHKEKLPALETILGSHAIEKAAKKLAAMETQMGSHSTKKQVKESAIEGMEVNELPSSGMEVHNDIAPLHNHLITDEELKSVKSYSDHSTTMNSALHDHYKYGYVPDRVHERDGVIKNIARLDSALSKHKTSGDMVVYTGIKKSPASFFKDPERKVKVHLPAFTSTSTDHHVAKFFASGVKDPANEDHGIDPDVETHHVLKLHVPKGSHAMSLIKHSWMPGEQEVLLHRGHSVVIHPKPEYVGNNTYHWTAHIHSHEPEDINKD